MSRTSARILLAAVAASGWIRADVASDLAQAAESPYEIERFVETHAVFDWHPLWKALKLTDDTGLPACEERLDAGRDCSSELISVLEPEQTIVLLRHNVSDFVVYLRYVPEKSSSGASQWRFAGHYQPKVKYFPPRHRIVRFGKRPYLTLTEQGASGSGLSREDESWIDLTQGNMKRVFWYTNRGTIHPFTGGIARDIVGTVVALNEHPLESVRVGYSIDFSIEDASGVRLNLGQRRDQAVFVRRSPEAEFVLDEKLSGVSAKQIENLYDDLDSEITNEHFLKYDLESLKEIASGAETPQKHWLRQFLANCRETPEKQQLRAAFKSQSLVRKAK